MTVSDMVSLDTPPKNEAAPIKANAPGSIHAHSPILHDFFGISVGLCVMGATVAG